MAQPRSLAPELIICTLQLSLVSPHRKVINHSCVPGFSQNSVFTQPGTELFFFFFLFPPNLGHVTEFQLQIFGAVWTGTVITGGVGGNLPKLLPFVGPIPGKLSHKCAVVHSLWKHQAESRHLDLIDSHLASLLQCPRALLHSGTTRSSCSPKYPRCATVIPPTIPPKHL